MTNISTAPNSTTLPIRVNLDFSDQKSQNLFIFEQKYNMKKNDCFNVERQRDKLEKQLQQKHIELKELNEKYRAIQAELANQNAESSADGKKSETNTIAQRQAEKTIQDLEESHNQQL